MPCRMTWFNGTRQKAASISPCRRRKSLSIAPSGRRARPKGRGLTSSLRTRLELISDDAPAVLQLAIPTDLKVMTVDARLADKADSRDGSGIAGIGPIRRSPLADVVHVQIDRAADAANRQDAGNHEVAGADTSAA